MEEQKIMEDAVMDTLEKELKKDLRIDEHDIQREWNMQPTLFMKYASIFSKAIRDKDKITAYMTEQITAFPEKHGLDKVSEAGIQRVLNTQEQIIEANFQVNFYKNALQAFEHRKKALEYECQLMLGGFFAEPKEKPIRRKK